MTRLVPDLLYCWRAFQKSPGSSAVAILTPPLGIGANAAIQSWRCARSLLAILAALIMPILLHVR